MSVETPGTPRRPAAAPRWRSPVAVLVMLLATVGIGIPSAIVLTPARETVVAGQYVGVGGSTPSGGWLGDLDEITDDGPLTWPGAAVDGFTGPAELEQIGDTTIRLYRIQVRGPLRPRLELGPLVRTREADDLLDPRSGPAARDRAVAAITTAFRSWYLSATLLLVIITAAMITALLFARVWLAMTLATRRRSETSIHEAWGRHARRLRRDGAIVLVGTLLAWVLVGGWAWRDTRDGLAGVSSPRDLVGAAPVELQPAGRPVEGYAGAVIGDSRASRLGGPAPDDAGEVDEACGRSTDSLAAQVTRLSPGDRALNLACQSATIRAGLLGPQQIAGVTAPAQVERLLRIEGLRYVVVMVGPNDLSWADFLRYCYGVEECDDRFTSGQFDYRLAAFDRDYGDLLAALAALPDAPQVIVVGSYDVFAPDADCSDTEAPDGLPGLDEGGIALLAERNARFNDVLAAGVEAYGFDLVLPQLEPLCQPEDPEVGGDLQGLADPYPFHPTGVGMVRLGAGVLAAIEPPAE
ncbi:GDSL-type esterase/lipase family protein [Nocardioides sp. YIM 152588]|uniref:GDSL-type esterase/lipase family protein n=1 Tax=Nocardioides sp. YIM 152588 TaxID=3158259 RepID=UPI0032E42D95